MKKCNNCGLIKPLTEFYKDDLIKSGYKSRCKSCYKLFVKSYQESTYGAAMIAEYAKSESKKLSNKKYANTSNGRFSIKKANEKYLAKQKY